MLFMATTFLFSETAVTVAWDQNPETDIASYGVYVSTNSFQSVAFTNIVDFPTTTNRVPVQPNIGYSFYVTAKNTAGLESDPSTVLYYTQVAVKPNTPNNLILTGTNDWTGATLFSAPTNGTISGTLPNLTYTVTNLAASVDRLSYKIPSTGTNANYYYTVNFIFPNSPPSIRLQF
jgi:fibronectin type 3 domain-containing protein